MTTDEALDLVRQSEKCWIVFSSATGEVLAVVGESPDKLAQDSFSHLGNLSKFKQPVETRHFKSATVSREVLEREQGEAERVKTRVRILTEWSRATTEELIQVLEHGQYDYPMSKDFDSRVIVDDLWDLHRTEMSALPRARLTALLSSAALGADAAKRLRIYLAAFNGDEEHLKAIWKRAKPGRECLADDFALMEAFAHVKTKDTEIMSDIIGMFDSGMPFGAKFEAMMFLGRIGPVAGGQAAVVIRKAVHDSEPWIIAARDRVLERLASDEHKWMICGECCYGRVHYAEDHGAQLCPLCLGLGYRPMA